MSDELLTKLDIVMLAQAPVHTLAIWWCELNRWRWPAELPDPEPRCPNVPIRQTRRMAIMEWIEARLSERFVSRIWNSGMTDAEFNEFWQQQRRPDRASVIR